MTINSKRKGKTGEQEFCNLCKEQGYDVRRSVQYNGKHEEGQADVVGLPGIHVEVKRTEKLSLYEAMEQAKHDSKGSKYIVAHRRNNHPWLVIMTAEQWFELYREFEAGMSLQEMEGIG